MPKALPGYDDLVYKIHQCTLEPEIWPVVIGEIADWMGAANAKLFTPSLPVENGGFTFDHNVSPVGIELWRLKFQKEDLWVQSVLQKKLMFPGNVILDSDLLPESELRATAYYHDYLSLSNIARLSAGIVFGNDCLGVPETIFSVYRGPKDPRFKEKDRARFQPLLRHLSHALGVMFRLRDADLKLTANLAALESINWGILLFNSTAEVVFANRAALSLLEQDDGLRLKARAGFRHWYLAATDQRSDAQLERAIRQAIGVEQGEVAHFTHNVSVRHRSGRNPYSIQFASLHENNGFAPGNDAPRAIAFISDTTAVTFQNTELLVQIYKLTAAEAHLATTMSAGISIKEAAASHGVSPNTIKSQLQSIYGKTRVSGHAELVKLLFSLSIVRRN